MSSKRGLFAILAVAILETAHGQQGGFDLAAFQRTLENGCKCGKAFYSGTREDRRVAAVDNCLRQFPEVRPYEPTVPIETECPQLAISTYARLNGFSKWRRESFADPRAAEAFDNCLYASLGYLSQDGSVNQEGFQKDITSAYLEEPTLNRDRDALLLLQSVLSRAKSPVCTGINRVDEYVRCALKPCFGSAAVPKL